MSSITERAEENNKKTNFVLKKKKVYPSGRNRIVNRRVECVCVCVCGYGKQQTFPKIWGVGT